MTFYEIIRWANEGDHHPSADTAFTINDTVDKDTSFEIKYANRSAWAEPFANANNVGIRSSTNGVGELGVYYFNDTVASAVGGSLTIKYDKNNVYFDGVLKGTYAVPSTSTTGIQINHSRYGDNANSIDIYYVKMWQNGTLTHNYVPAKNDSNQIGMYDTVTQTFTQSTKATASLVNQLYTVSVSINPVGGGTVSGAGAYKSGTSVTLTATPSTKFNFVNWSNGQTSNSYTFTVSSDVSLTANFKRIANCRTKVNGSWKYGMMYVKANGTWKEGTIKVKNGTWKNTA